MVTPAELVEDYGRLCCRSEIEECPDQDTSKMQAKLSIVPIDQLALFIGKKVIALCVCLCFLKDTNVKMSLCQDVTTS